MLQGFFTPNDTQLTPDQVERLRVASALAARSGADTSPVAHWSAGLARLVDGWGGYKGNMRADTQEAAGMASADEAIRSNPVLASLLGGDQAGMATPSPVVNALVQQPGGAGTIQSAPTTSAPGVAGAFSGSSLAQGVLETAQAIGADPLDLATIISYETGGTFDPLKAGPTTQWGQHRGLIQFGEPQAQQYGVDFSTPEAALATQLGADGAIANYFRSSGYQPGMSGIDLYSTVNAGAPGRYSASDANNGGAPGDVSDKWNNQMAGHREKAAALLGGTYTPPTMSGGGASGGSPNNIVAILAQAQGNPWVAKKYGPVIEALMGQQMRRDDASFEQQMRHSDPMYQAQLQQAQLQLEQMQRPAPVEYGWQTMPDGTLVRTDSTGNITQMGQYARPEAAPDAPASVREYEYYVQQALARGEQPMPYEQFSVEKARAGASSVNVNTGSEVGTIPQGYELFVDPQTGARSMRPISGGPEDQSKAAAVKAENMETSTDIITGAAAKARAAAASRQFGSFGQGVAANMPWTDSAEVARQVEVLKANAKVENLQAMRAASPTGGALGAVSDSENAMLAAKAGALDPSSPTFERDLDDYERTLLRIVHGREAGDAIFERTRDAAPPTAPRPAMRGLSIGQVQDGYRYIGGDPADPASWEKN